MPSLSRDLSRVKEKISDFFLDLLLDPPNMQSYAENKYSRSSSFGSSSGRSWETTAERPGIGRRRRSDDTSYHFSTPRNPPTYGTYYVRSDDPSRLFRPVGYPNQSACSCTCCPHEGVTWRRQRRASSDAGELYSRRPASSSSSHRQSKYAYERAEPARSSSGNRRDASTGEKSHRSKGSAAIINVHDRSNGPLWSRYGDVFPLSIPADRSVQDVLHTLAPSGSGAKVTVYWDDGSHRKLDEGTTMRELRKHAARLEITKPKRVHWW
jgi:hypothetical protein